MTKKFILALLVCSIPFLAFSLNHQTKAPLWDHLVEVNVQWDHLEVDPGEYQIPIQFDSDVDRIQMHLLLVENYLNQHSLEGLSSEQTTRRGEMLDQLKAYALEGRFPINAQHNTRTPYFIDHQGTACAVGHLLIQSGHEDFAYQVQSEMNHSYLLDMPYAEIGSWADAYGFTKAELAWIQPGYPPTTVWGDLLSGGGANGSITFVQEHPLLNGLIIAGNYTNLEGVACAGVCYYDGSIVFPFGTVVPDGIIRDIAWYNNKIYACGDFNNNGGTNMSIWDGANWSFQKIFAGPIYSVEVINDTVYAGGHIQHSGGALISNVIQLKNNGIWEGMGQGLNDTVRTLRVYDGKLYAGGYFDGTSTGSLPGSYMATWENNQWQGIGVGNGPNSPVMTMTVDGNDLYTGGRFSEVDSMSAKPGLFKYDGSVWDSLLSSAATLSYPHTSDIRNIRRVTGRTYVQGTFSMNPLVGTIGSGLGYVVPSSKSLEPLTQPSMFISDFAVLNDQAVVGGTFTMINASMVNNVAIWNATVAVEESALLEVQVYPQPMSVESYVKIPQDQNIDAYALKVYDLSGKVVRNGVVADLHQFKVERGDLSVGVYLLSLEHNGERVWSDKLLVR